MAGQSALTKNDLRRAWIIVAEADSAGVSSAYRRRLTLWAKHKLPPPDEQEPGKTFLALIWEGMRRNSDFSRVGKRALPMAPGVAVLLLSAASPCTGSWEREPKSLEEAAKCIALATNLTALAILSRGRRLADFLAEEEFPDSTAFLQILRWDRIKIFSASLQLEMEAPAKITSWRKGTVDSFASGKQALQAMLSAGDLTLSWQVDRLKNQKQAGKGFETDWNELPFTSACPIRLLCHLWILRLTYWPEAAWRGVLSLPIHKESLFQERALTKRRFREFFKDLQEKIFGKALFTPRDARNGVARATRRLAFKGVFAMNSDLQYDVGMWKPPKSSMPRMYAGFDGPLVGRLIKTVIVGSTKSLLAQLSEDLREKVWESLTKKVWAQHPPLTTSFSPPKEKTNINRTPSPRRRTWSQ